MGMLTGQATFNQLTLGQLVVFEPGSSASNFLCLTKEQWRSLKPEHIEEACRVSQENRIGFEARVPFEYVEGLRDKLIELGFKNKRSMTGAVSAIEENLPPPQVEAVIPSTADDQERFIHLFASAFRYTKDEARKVCSTQIFQPQNTKQNLVYIYFRSGDSEPVAVSQSVIFDGFSDIGYLRYQAVCSEEPGDLHRSVIRHCKMLLLDRGVKVVTALIRDSASGRPRIRGVGGSEVVRFSTWIFEP